MKRDAPGSAAWAVLEAALADPELLETAPDFGERVMARISARAAAPAAEWFAVPAALRRPGAISSLAPPSWLAAATVGFIALHTWQAYAACWRTTRRVVFARSPMAS
jgi:hypothetical protein